MTIDERLEHDLLALARPSKGDSAEVIFTRLRTVLNQFFRDRDLYDVDRAFNLVADRLEMTFGPSNAQLDLITELADEIQDLRDRIKVIEDKAHEASVPMSYDPYKKALQFLKECGVDI